MKNIAGKDFLLSSRTAKRLYSDYAERMPIIDFHCHLSPAEIAGDKRFSDIGELMLGADHYKWRAMRSFGIDEKYITGDATFRDKFRKFAGMLPYAAGNPLYAWT
ncbi:MAG: glucuronate isomerase, partial [Clostridia bacterium]|nr:glucuronate isomerase [Clostridia bacterium]